MKSQNEFLLFFAFWRSNPKRGKRPNLLPSSSLLPSHVMVDSDGDDGLRNDSKLGGGAVLSCADGQQQRVEQGHDGVGGLQWGSTISPTPLLSSSISPTPLKVWC
ncbi:hypothetical protein Droror1_Dr00005812 [Drosera rotundifolia]